MYIGLAISLYKNCCCHGSESEPQDNTVSGPSDDPTLCIDTALTSITHNTTGATGIGSATGLPAGVTASWSNGVITVSGTPTASGTFNYSIPLTGGTGSVSATGTITVNPSNTVSEPSGDLTIAPNTEITPITHNTTGATGIGTPTGLPPGLTATWVDDTIVIEGTPEDTGSFSYSIPLTGGCSVVTGSGTIVVGDGDGGGGNSFSTQEQIDTSGASILNMTFEPLTIQIKATSYQVNPIETGYITVEGDTIKTTTLGSRGHTLAVFDSQGSVVGSIDTYDTFGESPANSTANLASLISALNSVQTGNYITLLSWDACAVNQGLRDVLNNSFGGTETATWAPTRYSHTFIGRKA
jgi:hypothetical protein